MGSEVPDTGGRKYATTVGAWTERYRAARTPRIQLTHLETPGDYVTVPSGDYILYMAFRVKKFALATPVEYVWDETGEYLEACRFRVLLPIYNCEENEVMEVHFQAMFSRPETMPVPDAQYLILPYTPFNVPDDQLF